MQLNIPSASPNHRQTTLRFVVALLLLTNIAACSLYSDGSAKLQTDLKSPVTPNFIVVLTDDQGWTSLSTSMDKTKPQAKSDYYQTPHIDALVERGMRFSNGYAAAPVCSPTRYSILFGKSPARLQRTKVEKVNRVDHDQAGIPQVLKSINPDYRAAHFGKWHIGANPSRYGYDVHDGETTNKEGGFVNKNVQWKGYAEDDPKRVHSITSRAIGFMRESVAQKKPFYLQLSHYALHSNIVYSESSFAHMGEQAKGQLHRDQGYAAMVHDMDLSVGDLLAAYRELGLADNTYIIFTSDNGGMPVLPMQVNRGKPYNAGLNTPLLRGKWDLTEGGIRVPFAVMGPGIEMDSQSDTPVISYDLMPTLADLAGSMQKLPKDIDGGSFRTALFNGDTKVKRSFDSLVFHFPHYNRVGMNEPHSAIRFGNYKLIHFPASGRSLLFDLEQDVSESHDLSKQRLDLTALLKEKLSAYLLSVDAERPEKSATWFRVGKKGTVRTQFFERYSSSE